MALLDTSIDDRTFDQLVSVLRKQLPSDYTDHNPSDPGIMLLELFCWLGEMALYRMDQVPSAHRDGFLDLLLASPVPAVVDVTFTVVFAAVPLADLVFPVGTRVATDFTAGRRTVFETLETVTVAIPDPAALTQSVSVAAREFLEVRDEELGVSDGTPRQTFELRPLRSALGLAPEHPVPILVDYANRSADHDPNPSVITFGGALTSIPGAVVSPANGIARVAFDGEPADEHFLLEYDGAGALTLTRSDGVARTAVLSADSIAAGETESAEFPDFELRIELSDAFDKGTPIAVGTNSVSLTGAGTIPDVSIRLVSIQGSIAGIMATRVDIGNVASPAALTLTLPGGFTGTFDGTSLNVQEIELGDGDGNSITIELEVTVALDAANAGAFLVLGALENLVSVGVQHWEAQHSLLTNASRPGGTTPRHFRVDPVRRILEFGDDQFGAITTIDHRVRCERYQVLEGPGALVEAGAIAHVLTPITGLSASDVLTVTNADDAHGGQFFFEEEKREAEGLKSIGGSFRVVTAHDFQLVLSGEFNEYQELAGRPERISRAVALMNRKPSDDTPAPANVTVIVMRELSESEAEAWSDRATSLADKASFLTVGGTPLDGRVLAFLEERRLITTMVHVVEPSLKAVGVELTATVDPHLNLDEMQARVSADLSSFFDLFTGGLDGGGWEPGRGIYRSDVHQIVARMAGVDHVNSLVLTPADTYGDVAVGAREIPVLDTLAVTVLRA